jgi:Fe-S cluster assembly protein SufD
MNLEVKPTRTAAEQALADLFARARGALPGAGAVASAREAAFRRFEATGLPSWRTEAWKYTDLRAMMQDAKPLAAGAASSKASSDLSPGASLLPDDFEARRLTFVDGAFAPERSDLGALESGVAIRSMAEALRAGDALLADSLSALSVAPSAPHDPMESLSVVREFAADPAVALNTALFGDGIVIHVKAGATVERPIHLLFLAGERPASVFARSLIVVEKGARAMVIESHPGGAGHQVNAAFEMIVGDEAHVDHVRLVQGAADGLHVSSILASVGAHARFNSFVFNTGDGAIRNQSFVRFAGEHTIASLGGASLVSGRQHVDNTLVAEHVAPHCQSREVFKGVVDDAGRSVFQGKAIVRQKAQKTDARMETRALLLSDEAEADHKPELEIFADDVQCGHGATTGALDENLRFYLMARGIPKPEAEALLIQSFVGAAVETVEHAGLRDALMDAVAGWLRRRTG